ncbi:HAMP domain-containing protein [Acidithiobacillus sp. RW2]|uniref:histidine kinase n=2 Tax=Acidithiobacillus sulfurivorans TaxID=1958756 RepID=A0ABS6A1N3_9PROT|nr:HAMP domain-containing protein [Acidithiobacillus sulfurivorans]
MRTFWPRSTLGRTLLLLGLLLLGTQAAVYVLFHQYVMNPAAERFAEFLLQTDHALISSGAQYAPTGNLQWRPASAKPGKIPDKYFMDKTAHYVQQQVPGARLRVGLDEGSTTWMWIRGGPHQPWLGMPVSPMSFGGQGFMFMRLGVIALVTLLGAWLIVRQINRPLARLAAEAPRIGLGDTPDNLQPIGGPLEVQHLTQAITGMANDLHRLHEERTLLLTGISHELRTPLSRLLLILHLPDSDFLEQKSAMRVDVNEMDETIDKFLTLVRSGDQEKAVVVNVRNWLEEMQEIARERYGLDIRVAENHFAVAENSIRCRPLALERVFRIIFDNTRRYGDGSLQIRVLSHPGHTEIQLRDYGPGVSAAHLLAMNQGTLPRQTGHGAGIGIRICKRIMDLHGGTIYFENAAEGGLVVRLQFPVTAPLRT